MTTYAYAYSSHYTPPAPVVEIEVQGTRTSSSRIRLAALLDSGADATALPEDVLTAAGARYVDTMYMQGIAGIRIPVDLYQVTIQVGPHVLPAIRAISLAQGADAVIGRDVLNQLVVTLDGLANVAEIQS